MSDIEDIPDWRREGIVADDAFVRRMPSVLIDSAKMKIDYLVYCCDIIYHSYKNLLRYARCVEDDIGKIDEIIRMQMFVSSWSIVDHLHGARQIISSFSPRNGHTTGHTKKFLEDSEVVTKLRNAMDHLPDKIANLAEKKSLRSPLFGIVSYVYATDLFRGGATMVAVRSGHVHGKDSWTVPRITGKPFVPPVDFFRLDAFGFGFHFAPLIDKLAASVRKKLRAMGADNRPRSKRTFLEIWPTRRIAAQTRRWRIGFRVEV